MKQNSPSIVEPSLFDPPHMRWSALPPDRRAQAIEQMALLLVRLFESVRSCEEVQEHERQD